MLPPDQMKNGASFFLPESVVVHVHDGGVVDVDAGPRDRVEGRVGDAELADVASGYSYGQ